MIDLTGVFDQPRLSPPSINLRRITARTDDDAPICLAADMENPLLESAALSSRRNATAVTRLRTPGKQLCALSGQLADVVGVAPTSDAFTLLAIPMSSTRKKSEPLKYLMPSAEAMSTCQ